MKKQKIYNPLLSLGMMIVIVVCFTLTSCKKQDDFLNAKRSNSDVTPTTLSDFQAILDGSTYMNTNYPDIALLGTDNSYLTTTVLNGATVLERNSYIWAADIYQGTTPGDWSHAYQVVEYANIVLDGLKNITVDASNQLTYNQIRGSALFYRSIAFYNLAMLFATPYNATSANTDLGIPIRLSSDINIPSSRTTIQATYTQIINDLQTSLNLLPVTPLYKTRPCQDAANALLAKVYLNMEDYTNAGIFANAALTSNNTLLDYNNTTLVSPTSTYHFPNFATGNPEVIFYAYGDGYNTLWPDGTGNVDTLLYRSYAANDLRKTFFYTVKGTATYFYGGYTGSAGYNFTGIANDELYLIRAECYARSGNVSAAMSDLNALLLKRWKTGTFVPYTATSSINALTEILSERRKELPFTSLIRWEDLRRLNKDPQFAISLTHVYNGTTYMLLPNDKRYVYPIPDLEIQLFGLQQNPR